MGKIHIKLAKALLIVCFFTSTLMNAQKSDAPEHTYKIEGSIESMTLTDSGVLLVTHGDGLAGIKPGQAELVFDFSDYGKVKEEEIFVVPNSPYVMVGQQGLAGISAKQSVIDIVTGQRVFDTKAQGWKAVGRPSLLLPENKLIVSGQRNAKEKYAQAVGIYDMGTGKEEKMYTLKGTDQMTGKPSIINGGLIIPGFKGLYRIDLASGEETWNLKLKDVDYVEPANDGKTLYAFVNKGTNHEVHKIDINTGAELWDEGKKLKGKVANFEITSEGLALVSNVYNQGKKGLAKLTSASSQSNISFLDNNTGEDLWEKAPKTKGYVQHFYIVNDGILFGLMEGGINKISFDGNPLFKKPLKTGENIHTMALTNQGMIYITDSDANIIDLKTGESIWNKPIQYKKAKGVASTYDKERGRYLISTGNEVIAIDENSGDVSTLATYEFKEKETPSSISVRDAGILLSSDQNMLMLNFDGSTKFQEYYASPGKSTFAKIAMGTLAVASTAMAMSTAAVAGANRSAFGSVNDLGSYNETGKQAKRASDMFASIGTASFNEMAKRFKASSATKDSQFILSKLDDGVGLVKLSKDTGKPTKEIILNDKKPDYTVDDFGGYLYYKASNNSINAYNLNN